MRKTLLLTCCIFLLSLPIFSQKANVDSLQKILGQPNLPDTSRWQVMNELVGHFTVVKPEQGKPIARQQIELASRLDETLLCRSLLNLATLYTRTGGFDSTAILIEESLKISHRLGENGLQGKGLKLRGDVHREKNELPQAVENYKAALKLVETPLDSGGIFINSGITLFRMHRHEEALTNYLLALPIAQRIQNLRMEAYVHSNIANVYKDLGKNQLSIEYSEKSNAVLEQMGDKVSLLASYSALGSLYLGPMNDREKGMAICQKGIRLAEQLRDTVKILGFLSHIALHFHGNNAPDSIQIYALRGLNLSGNRPAFQVYKARFLAFLANVERGKSNPGKAFLYARQAVQLHPPDRWNDWMPIIYKEMYESARSAGRHELAIDYLEKYVTVKDSLLSEERIKKFAELDARYQTAEKDKSIALLENEKLSQAAEISRRRSQVLYLSLAAVALLLGGGLFFYRNRYRQTLALEQMRTRIAGDLHDEVGSSLSRLNFLVGSFDLQNDPERTATNIEKSKDIMQKTASDIRDVVWAIDSRRDKTGDLLDRMEDFAFDMLAARQIKSHFSHDGLDRELALNPFVRQNIYLIFKEAVNNIARHSTADEVNISLKQQGKSLEMRIADNGKTASPQKVKGLGLESMQVRAQRIGGTVEVRQESDGFQVHLQAPL